MISETETDEQITYYVEGLDCVRCEQPIAQPKEGVEHITALCDECIARQFVCTDKR